MSKIKIVGHASGTGVLTIAAPNTNTDRTITIPDVTGTLLDSGSDLPAANLTGTIAIARIADDAVTAAKLANSINTDIATGPAALPKAGGTMTGNIAHAGDFTIDAGGDITLDADGADIKLKDAGTLFGSLVNASGDFKIVTEVADKDLIFRGNDGGSFITAMTIDYSAGGKVGIGVSSPLEVLHLKAASGDTRLMLDAVSGSDTEIKFYNAGVSQYTIGHDDGTDNFVIGTANVDTPLVSVNKSGNVGIGTSTVPLLGSSGTTLTIRGDADDPANIELVGGNASGEIAGKIGAAYTGNLRTSEVRFGLDTGGADNGYLSLLTGNLGQGGSLTERLRISKVGNIHFGSNAHSAPWNITSGTSIVTWFPSNGQLWAVANNTFPLALNRTGASGDTGNIIKFYFRGTITGDVSTTTSGVSYNTGSDYRLKENVDYIWDATTRLKQLKPARFNFIADDTNTLVDGFIAHEVSSVVPEAISGAKDAMRDETDEEGNVTSVPDMQGIDQSKLVPLLVKTIQELEARITALEA